MHVAKFFGYSMLL